MTPLRKRMIDGPRPKTAGVSLRAGRIASRSSRRCASTLSKDAVSAPAKRGNALKAMLPAVRSRTSVVSANLTS
jgi:hypothetical protein